MTRPVVAIWKSTLLPYSETFVRTQGESLLRYQATYFGLSNACELALPGGRSFLLNDRGMWGRAAVNTFKLTGWSFELVREMKRRDVALVHAHFGTEAWRAHQLSRTLNVPLIVTFHGADATTSDAVLRRTSASARQYVRHRGEIFRRADLCIAVSRYIADRLVSAGCPREKVVVHEIGVDTALFTQDEAVERELGILFVGRLVEKKGVAHLLESLRLLQGHGDHAPELVVVGDGPQSIELKALATKLALRVRFVGRQDHDAVRRLMQRLTVLVVPSQDAESGESEGLPTVIREAQACGLPVIVTDTAGAAEAVHDRRTGIVVPTKDRRALAEALNSVLTDSALRNALAMGALVAARAKDVGTQSRLLEALYDKVLEAKR